MPGSYGSHSPHYYDSQQLCIWCGADPMLDEELQAQENDNE